MQQQFACELKCQLPSSYNSKILNVKHCVLQITIILISDEFEIITSNIVNINQFTSAHIGIYIYYIPQKVSQKMHQSVIFCIEFWAYVEGFGDIKIQLSMKGSPQPCNELPWT